MEETCFVVCFVELEEELISVCKLLTDSGIQGKSVLSRRAATNSYFHYWVLCQLVSRFIDLLSENHEKCKSLFPESGLISCSKWQNPGVMFSHKHLLGLGTTMNELNETVLHEDRCRYQDMKRPTWEYETFTLGTTTLWLRCINQLEVLLYTYKVYWHTCSLLLTSQTLTISLFVSRPSQRSPSPSWTCAGE